MNFQKKCVKMTRHWLLRLPIMDSHIRMIIVFKYMCVIEFEKVEFFSVFMTRT